MAYATDNTEVPLEEENSAETNADKIVKAIRDDLMHQSIDAGNGAEGMKIAALAAEFDSRLSKRVEQPPAHIDPREHIEEGAPRTRSTNGSAKLPTASPRKPAVSTMPRGVRGCWTASPNSTPASGVVPDDGLPRRT